MDAEEQARHVPAESATTLAAAAAAPPGTDLRRFCAFQTINEFSFTAGIWIIFLPRGAWPACVPSGSGAPPPLEPSRGRACYWQRPGTRCAAGTERRRAVCRSFRANDRASREYRHQLRAAGDGSLGRGFSLFGDDDLSLPAVRLDRGALWLAAPSTVSPGASWWHCSACS
jgi:hypothetical protein